MSEATQQFIVLSRPSAIIGSAPTEVKVYLAFQTNVQEVNNHQTQLVEKKAFSEVLEGLQCALRGPGELQHWEKAKTIWERYKGV